MAIKYMERKHKLTKDLLDTTCMIEVAKRARNGRQVARFCDTIVRYMRKNNMTKLDTSMVEKCFAVLGVDENGLTRIDKIMLKELAKMNTCVGLDTLDAVLPANKKQIKEYIEPYLLKQGYIVRTSAGRMITSKGMVAISDRKTK
jgi:Holliday junction DNA helicase RuvB